MRWTEFCSIAWKVTDFLREFYEYYILGGFCELLWCSGIASLSVTRQGPDVMLSSPSPGTRTDSIASPHMRQPVLALSWPALPAHVCCFIVGPSTEVSTLHSSADALLFPPLLYYYPLVAESLSQTCFASRSTSQEQAVHLGLRATHPSGILSLPPLAILFY
jgi:hypothetical protein